MSKTPTPFGSWASPLSAATLAGATLRLGGVSLQDDAVFWCEGRPQEGGRQALVRRNADGRERELVPLPFNVRTRVHEYGGGAYGVLPDGVVFSHFDDGQLYRVDRDGGTPRRLTDDPNQRYADLHHDPARDRLLAIREDHRPGGPGGPGGSDANDAPAALVGINLDGGRVSVLAEGRDFYASPAFAPDGARLAWLAWDHPHMPWDAAELWLAGVDADGALVEPRRIAGGPTESIFQPQWSPDGALHFVSDRSGWWNLYRLEADGAITALHPAHSEFGRPQWVFGMSTYGFDAHGRIVCCHVVDGLWRLARLDPARGTLDAIETPFVAIDELRVGADFAVFIGATVDAAAAVVRLELDTGAWQVLRASSSATLDAAFVSVAEPIEFPRGSGASDDSAIAAHPDAVLGTPSGAGAGAGAGTGPGTGAAPASGAAAARSVSGEAATDRAHAFFYPPRNRDHTGPPGARPPLIVVSHGGPTAATDAGFKGALQFWTTRGFAVVDVNYGGSTGYGRAYRERLDGRWGLVDVDDCIAAARFLVARGDVDGARVAIRGGSAGGYTTLCALAFRDFFAAGASLYGIGDLETLAADTHKFESRYLDRLIGPWPAARATYRARSPAHHTARLSSPMILLQGAEDKVVPPSQAQAMFDAVNAKGLPVAYLLFEGEQHGFRRAATIRRALEAELYFYGRVFGFIPADAIEPVDIRNLPMMAGK